MNYVYVYIYCMPSYFLGYQNSNDLEFKRVSCFHKGLSTHHLVLGKHAANRSQVSSGPNCCLLLFFSNIIEPLFHLSPTFFPPLPNHPPRKTGRVCVSFQRFRGTLLTMELISESHKRFGGSKVQEAIAHVAFVPAETFTKVSWSG